MCRPHILCFDESYQENYFRAQSAHDAFERADIFIVLGTQLKTNLPARLVREAQKQKKLILEGNIDPVITYGKVMVMSGDLEQQFSDLVARIEELALG
jgi:NAD-dependent SIR2 family protein deacetylase